MDIESTIVTPEAVVTPESVVVEAAPEVNPESIPAADAEPEVVIEAPKPAETILGATDAPKVEAPIELVVEPEKTTEELKTAEQSNEQESNPSEEPAPLPTYEEFTAPEGFDLDMERIGDFANTLAEFELKTKADHAEVQALGQALVERHVAEVKNAVDKFTDSLSEAFDNQKTVWKEAFENDPEIGGNRKDTTVSAALEFIRTHGGTQEQQAEFHKLMEETGVGNHPAMIRMLAKAKVAMAEGGPLPGTAPAPLSQNKIQKRYGTN